MVLYDIICTPTIQFNSNFYKLTWFKNLVRLQKLYQTHLKFESEIT